MTGSAAWSATPTWRRTPAGPPRGPTTSALPSRSASPSTDARREHGQPARWPGLDQPPERVRVGMVGDQVAQPVQAGLPEGGEVGLRGDDEASAGRACHLGEEGPAEAVVLQGAVPGRAEHRAAAPAVQERLRAVVDAQHAVVD